MPKLTFKTSSAFGGGPEERATLGGGAESRAGPPPLVDDNASDFGPLSSVVDKDGVAAAVISTIAPRQMVSDESVYTHSVPESICGLNGKVMDIVFAAGGGKDPILLSSCTCRLRMGMNSESAIGSPWRGVQY